MGYKTAQLVNQLITSNHLSINNILRYTPKRSLVVGSGGIPVSEFLRCNPADLISM